LAKQANQCGRRSAIGGSGGKFEQQSLESLI